MTEHKFGGDWTEKKLSYLKDYLKAYRQIFTRNERARHLKTWYVDAFAGTGFRRVSGSTACGQLSVFEDVYEDTETTEYRDGSAKMALTLAEPFDFYLFIEKSMARVVELEEAIKRDHADLFPRCDFRHGDANDVLEVWCQERDWKRERAVVFLDPYGMQVEWRTIEALARTKATDLWYLFPLGVGVSRLLTHSGDIEEGWQRRLDLLFGTTAWRTNFYRLMPSGQADLFGETSHTVERDAPVAKIEAFIHSRLEATFVKAAKGQVLRNSKQSPLYLLCFAAANEKGAPTALRIAQDILKKD